VGGGEHGGEVVLPCVEWQFFRQRLVAVAGILGCRKQNERTETFAQGAEVGGVGQLVGEPLGMVGKQVLDLEGAFRAQVLLDAIGAAAASLDVVGEASQQVVHVGAVVARSPKVSTSAKSPPVRRSPDYATDIVSRCAPLQQRDELMDVLVLLVAADRLVVENPLDEAAVQVGRDQPGLGLDRDGGVVRPDRGEHETSWWCRPLTALKNTAVRPSARVWPERGGEQGAVVFRQVEQILDELVEAVLADEVQTVTVALDPQVQAPSISCRSRELLSNSA